MEEESVERGIISSIYLENFITYNNVIIKPGRHLNLIIGPNGTGKSTIVCAIVLGLGGKLNVIGRALHIAEYVKTGCKEAKIEIKLKESNDETVTVTRLFNTDGKSCWILNGKAVNIKAIKELTTSFNIQVDNLCQFLPQDKVQDFSKMNAQELLENTERSVGDPILFEYHNKLKEYRLAHKDLETELVSKQHLLESKTQKYEGLKEIVSTIKEKQTIKNKIITLKQKKAWMVYDQKRKQLVDSKKKRDSMVQEMKSIETKLIPIKNKIQKMQSEIKILEHSVNEHSNSLFSKVSSANKLINDITQNENSIKESVNACSRRIQAEENRDQEISLAQQQKNKLDNDLCLILKEVESEDTLIQEQRKILARLEEQRNIITTLTNQVTTCKQEEELFNHKIKGQQAERQALNIEAKRLELLKRRSLDAYQGVIWLRKNQDKFSATVHEPMLLNINIKEVTYAKYLESIIPIRDSIAFVCETKEDMNLLLKYLRDEEKLQVNVVYSDPMKKVYMQPNIPLESIKQFGFNHYLVSLIEAPTTIMKYLVSRYNLNNIPVGSNIVRENVDRIPHSLTCYFTENTAYSVNMSKYTGEKSTRMVPITGNGALSIVLDKSKLYRIDEKLKVYIEKKNDVLNRAKVIEEKIRNENEEIDKCRAIRNKYQDNIQRIEALRSRIRMANTKIEDLENERTSVEEIKNYYTCIIQGVLQKQLDIYEKYNTLLEDKFKCVTINEEGKLALKLHKGSLINTENSAQELIESLSNAEQAFKQLDEEYRPLKVDAMKAYNEAKELTNGLDPQDDKFKRINKAFSKLPATIQDIEKEVAIAQTKVFCMGNNVDGENILKEYEEVEANIQNLNEFIRRKTEQSEKMQQNINTLREKWLPSLERLIERINTNFSGYFSDMNCAGEVTLVHENNIMDFDKYGLRIKVKFRDCDELQELTRHHQSGGERAVTTAIYMIALQKLSRVPFRCVDEINQGMDAANERRIFELLVKMTGNPGNSQYFLLTPKLLPDLSYTETVTVHCVFNGPFMIPHAEYETEKYCEHIVRNSERIEIND